MEKFDRDRVRALTFPPDLPPTDNAEESDDVGQEGTSSRPESPYFMSGTLLLPTEGGGVDAVPLMPHDTEGHPSRQIKAGEDMVPFVDSRKLPPGSRLVMEDRPPVKFSGAIHVGLLDNGETSLIYTPPSPKKPKNSGPSTTH